MHPIDKVVVYGASGHGKVVAEVARSCGHEVLGFIDDGVAAGTPILGTTVLGNFNWLLEHRPAAVIALGIGANRVRETVASRLVASGFALGSFVHTRAWVSPSATLGRGTVVMAGAVINAEASMGAGVIVNSASVIEHECVIGDFAHISPRAALGGGVLVGARTHVGLGVSVRPFARIGADAVIGAGAVVLAGCADGVVIAGVPAKPIR